MVLQILTPISSTIDDGSAERRLSIKL